MHPVTAEDQEARLCSHGNTSARFRTVPAHDKRGSVRFISVRRILIRQLSAVVLAGALLAAAGWHFIIPGQQVVEFPGLVAGFHPLRVAAQLRLCPDR